MDGRITGAVLAGGRGRRMGGADKGLVAFHGRPLVARVLDALRPQVGPIIISANRNRARYAAYAYPVVDDEMADYPGPLAGVASVLAAAATPLVLIAPCDGPFLPGDLAPRLYHALGDSDIAAVHDGQRLQPLFALLRTRLLADLRDYLDAGQRRVEGWYAQQRLSLADFSDQPEAFVNINRLAQRRQTNPQGVPE